MDRSEIDTRVEYMNLEPCPFCDTVDYLGILPIGNVGIYVTYAVVCDNCGARGPKGHSEDQASLHWASRHQQALTPDELDALATRSNAWVRTQDDLVLALAIMDENGRSIEGNSMCLWENQWGRLRAILLERLDMIREKG